MTQRLVETPDLHGAFPRLSDEQIVSLTEHGKHRHVEPGDVLDVAGEITDEVIRAGLVAIIEGDPAEERIVAAHGPGRFLGELSVVT